MEIIYIFFITILASMLGTMTGFGTSTVMIPILVLWLPPVETIFLVSIVHWFGNIWKVVLFKSGIHLKLILLFGASGLIASYLGAAITLEAGQVILLRVLGGFLVAYSLFLLLQQNFKIPATNSTALGGGALSGFFAGMFGIGGAIRSMFLTAFDLPKAVYIATAGAIGLLVDSTRIVTYVAGGTELSQRLWLGLLLFIPASFLGAQLAKRIVDRIPQSKFRWVVVTFLFAVGVKLIFWP